MYSGIVLGMESGGGFVGMNASLDGCLRCVESGARQPNIRRSRMFGCRFRHHSIHIVGQIADPIPLMIIPPPPQPHSHHCTPRHTYTVIIPALHILLWVRVCDLQWDRGWDGVSGHFRGDE